MNEQTVNQEEMQQPTKKPFYKKWWVWGIAAVVVVVAISLFSGGDAVQDDLLDYLNNDRTEMVELDAEVAELYEKAQNSANDYTMYEILIDEVIPKSKELIKEAESIDMKTEEVKDVHERYLDAINKQNQALTLLLSALENQDYTALTQANEKLDESRKLMRNYESALTELAKEHDVELIYE